jgi:hypothetical protein
VTCADSLYPGQVMEETNGLLKGFFFLLNQSKIMSNVLIEEMFTHFEIVRRESGGRTLN